MAAILGLLQFAKPMWPGMGSEVVIELWKSESGRDVVRILWSGKPLETNTPLGTLDMVPLPDFLDYLEHTVPADLVSACAS
jgi:acid phosphatase